MTIIATPVQQMNRWLKLCVTLMGSLRSGPGVCLACIGTTFGGLNRAALHHDQRQATALVHAHKQQLACAGLDKPDQCPVPAPTCCYSAERPACTAVLACSPLQRNAQFKHYGSENFSLNVPEFSVAPGELVAVVGRVGAGKSSLFHAILGNMQPVTGTAEVGGRVSFVPQNPWCQNLTLRDNILFGLPFDEEKYERVSVGSLQVSECSVIRLPFSSAVVQPA